MKTDMALVGIRVPCCKLYSEVQLNEAQTIYPEFDSILTYANHRDTGYESRTVQLGDEILIVSHCIGPNLREIGQQCCFAFDGTAKP